MSSPPARAPGEDWLAYALIVTPLVGTGVASGYHPFLAPIFLALIVHFLAARLGKRLEFSLGIVGYALAALPVAMLFQTFEVKGAGGQQYHNSFYFALGSLVFATLRVFSPPNPARLSWVLLFGGGALTATGLGLPGWLASGPAWHERFPGGQGPHPTTFYVGLVVVFGLLAVVVARVTMWDRAFAEVASRGRKIGVLLACGLTVAVSFTISRGVTVYYDDLNSAFLNMFSGANLRSSGGFSGEAQLGSVTALRDGVANRRVALRVFTDAPPGYMRGKTFLLYEEGRWHTGRPVPALRVETLENSRWTLTERETPASATLLTVRPASHISAHFFLPLGATAVETATRKLLIGPGDTLRTGDEPTTSGYEVYVDATQPVHAEGDREVYLELPEDPELLAALDLRLRDAGVPQVDPATPADAVGPLERWFSRAYKYQFGIKFDRDRDPLVQFLTEKSHGHCELFASSGTLMLRRLGIPARYVTGFICDEKNEYSDLYLARDEYAHAWVEYYDPARGWQLAEFTPSSGMPQVHPAQGMESFTDGLSGLWNRFKDLFRGGLSQLPGRVTGALRDLVLWIAGAWWRMSILFLFVLGYLARNLVRKRAARLADVRYAQRFTDEFASERERYLALEERLERAKLGRGPAETVMEWADRLDGEELPEDEDKPAALALIRAFAIKRYSQQAVAP